MTGILKVLKTMSISASRAELLASAAKRAANQTEPEIFLEIALTTMFESYDSKRRQLHR